MPTIKFGRHAAALGLLFAGSIALFGTELILSNVADAQTTEAIFDVHNLQSLPEAKAAVPMYAAVSTGQFEDLVRPTAVPTVAPTAIPTVAPTVAPTPEPPAKPALAVYESGIASTYGEGDGFEGNLTACGQVFHTAVVQVAHKSLPCGTLLRVKDTDTGNSVEAVVTDRGPYVAGRIVDLSWGAFRQLDPTGPGLIHVEIFLLES